MDDEFFDPEWRFLPAVERVVAIAHRCAGWKLPGNAKELDWLISKNVDPGPLDAYKWPTDCATSLLGILAHACVTAEQAARVHRFLATVNIPSVSISWAVTIMRERGAVEMLDGHTQPTHAPLPDEPAMLHYNTPGTNKDHVALLCGPTMPDGSGDIVEGGGYMQAINRSTRQVHQVGGWGPMRPLLRWLPVRVLGLPPAEQRPEEREAIELEKAEMAMKGAALSAEEKT